MAANKSSELTTIFTNDAFETYARFRNVAARLLENSGQLGEAFVKWICTLPSLAANQYWFHQQRWSKVLLGNRLCVVSGHDMAFSKSAAEDAPPIYSELAQAASFSQREKGDKNPRFHYLRDSRIIRSPGSYNTAAAAWAYFAPSPLSFETPFASFFSSRDWSSTAVESISEQLVEMTSLMSSFTQLSPVAMFVIDAKDGSLIFANEAW